MEKIGVQRALKYAKGCRFDPVCGRFPAWRWMKADEEILDLLKDKKCIILLNKTDLEPVVTEEMLREKIGDPRVCMITDFHKG